MALEENAYKVADATSDGVIPNLYNEQSEQYLYEKEQLRPLGVDMSGLVKGKPGSSFDVFKETAFSVSQLTEGVDTPVSALDFDKVTLVINWYGDAKQISKETLAVAFPFVLDSLRRGASGALAENRDLQILLELANTSSDAIYPEGKDDSNITVDDTLTKKQIRLARTALFKNKRKPHALIIHPDQEGALLDLPEFIDATKYPGHVLYNGEIGKIYGFRVIVHNSVQVVMEGASSDVPVYIGFALGERPFIWAQKIDPVFEFDEEYKRKRALTFHYYEAFGVKILHDESVIPVKSA